MSDTFPCLLAPLPMLNIAMVSETNQAVMKRRIKTLQTRKQNSFAMATSTSQKQQLGD